MVQHLIWKWIVVWLLAKLAEERLLWRDITNCQGLLLHVCVSFANEGKGMFLKSYIHKMEQKVCAIQVGGLPTKEWSCAAIASLHWCHPPGDLQLTHGVSEFALDTYYISGHSISRRLHWSNLSLVEMSKYGRTHTPAPSSFLPPTGLCSSLACVFLSPACVSPCLSLQLACV